MNRGPQDARATQGVGKDFSGLSSPYESAETPGFECDTVSNPWESCVENMVSLLKARGDIPHAA